MAKTMISRRIWRFARTDCRRILEDASLLIYDERILRRMEREGRGGDGNLLLRLATALKPIGLDLFDAKGNLIDDPMEGNRRYQAFFQSVLLRYVKHRDGRALTPAEANLLVQRETRFQNEGGPHAAVRVGIDERNKEDKQLENRVHSAMLRAFGLYVGFDFPFNTAPEYEFVLRLPGALVETNGVGSERGRTRWKFTSAQIFPDGYEMKARSLWIDRDAQRTALGRVAIDDEDGALEFIKLVGARGPLVEALRLQQEWRPKGAHRLEAKQF